VVASLKLGLGLYRHQLNAEHYRFARQCGCSHLVIHLVDYFRSSRSNQPGDQPCGDDSGWGLAGDPDRLWTFEDLAAIKKEINAHDLELEAVENFDPAHWHDGCSTAQKIPANRKSENHHPQYRPGRNSGLRLQFFHRRRRRTREGKVCARD
jgi:hypothetical protein